jgi:N-acetylglutamate synthase-like GNAT family acetyltransferase/protein-L-isoaspartate O-methyltransferase
MMSEVGMVRPATERDLGAAELLLRAASLPIEGLRDQFDDGFVVWEVDGTVIGVAGLEVYGSYGLLRSVAVAEDWRGRGVAEALVKDRVDWGAARGLRAIYLLTTTASGYFGRRGFASVDRDAVPAAVRRSNEFAEVCPATAIAMELRVAPQASACCGAPVLLAAGPATAAAATSCCAPSAQGTDTWAGGSPRPAVRGAQFTGVMAENNAEALKAAVREKYGSAAVRASSGTKSSCCGAAAEEVWDPITADLYAEADTKGLPTEAVLASLGCGNPTALAELREGDVVLDLGSGGGIDVLLSARRVGPTGKAYGLDMTDEMLHLARANQQQGGRHERRVPEGRDRVDPAAGRIVDVIISNCVINLSADKAKVLREAFAC